MSHSKKRLALLKRRAFLAYALCCIFSATGNGLGYVAMTWLVVTNHHSVDAVAILMACFWGPNVLIGPFMGVLVDRFSRQGMIVISCAARALVYIGFSCYLTRHFNVHFVYLLMLCIGTAFSAFYSSAFAFMRELVAPNELMYANSTIDIAYETGNVVGMGMAGLLIGWTSAEFAILCNGLLYVIATISLFFIHKTDLYARNSETTPRLQLFKDFREGLQYLKKRPTLMAIYIIQLLIMITFLTTPLLLVPFSKTVLHANVTQFGVIEASASLGIIIGGILMPWIGECWGFMRTLLFFCSVLAFTFLIFGYNHAIQLADVMYFMIGFSGAVWPLIITRAQNLTESNFQGRVQSTFNSLAGAMMLITFFSIGYIGQYFGVNHLYLIEVIITSLAIIFLIGTRQVWRN